MQETKRLILKPLTYEQLLNYDKEDGSLEVELKLEKTSRVIAPELKGALKVVLIPNVADKSKNYLYSTLWTAIDKDKNESVGDLCFFGEPNEAGEIEIGYGTYDEFRGNGYMIEAVSGMIGWAKTEISVKTILASTNKDNIASYSILLKNGFVKFGETESLFKWKLQL